MLVDTGRRAILDALTAPAPPEAFVLHLCTNTFIVDEHTILTDFAEAAWAGYVPQTIPGSAWGPAAVDASGNWFRLTGAPLAFSNGSGVTQIVTGYFYTGATSGILYSGAIFPIPIALLAGAGQNFLGEMIDNTLP